MICNIIRSTRITQLKRQRGSRFYASGRLWTGPNGGVWAEADARHGEFGWFLVNGPGFGLNGPALVDATDQAVIQIEILHLGAPQGIVYIGVFRKDATVAKVKQELSHATGLSMGYDRML